MAGTKKYIVEHSVLGSINAGTNSNHRKGEIVQESDFDAAVFKRFKELGAIKPYNPEENDDVANDLIEKEQEVSKAEKAGAGSDYADALAKVTTGNDMSDRVAAATAPDDKSKSKK